MPTEFPDDGTIDELLRLAGVSTDRSAARRWLESAQKVAEHPAAATQRPSTIHSFAISLLLRNPGSGAFPEPLRIADDWEQSGGIRHSRIQLPKARWSASRGLACRVEPGERTDLEENPEDTETARALLGHAWSKTTRIYVGSSSRRASRAYNRFVFEQREALKLKRKRQRTRKPKKGSTPCAS